MKYGISIMVDFEQDGMSVEKRKLLHAQFDPARELASFLPVLRKEITNHMHKRPMVTVHLMNDHYINHDEPQTRYILDDGWWESSGRVNGFQKRPYSTHGTYGGGYPEVDTTPCGKLSARTAMYRAIEEELTKLVNERLTDSAVMA